MRISAGTPSAAAGALYISVLLALSAVFCGPGATSAWSQVPDNRGLKLDPEDSVPPAYRDTLDRRDRQRLDAAREAGDSFMPVFQGRGAAPGAGPPAGALAAPRDAALAPTPPQPAYEPYRRPDSRPVPSEAQPGTADLIDVLIEAWSRSPEIVRVRYPPAAARDPDIASVRGAGGARQETPPAPLGIGTGRGLYARTLYAVDSDYPGPVLLELLEPPLAGAVVAGAFTLVGERLVLRLSRLEYRGRSVAVDAWAVGLDCACYGVAGEVDSHYFSRVLLPAAVRFAEGFLTALARPAESLSLGAGDVRYERSEVSTRGAVHAGLGTAARAAGDVLLENAPGPRHRAHPARHRADRGVRHGAGHPRGNGFRRSTGRRRRWLIEAILARP